MAGSCRGGMEILSDLKLDRFRELFALLDLKKSKSCNRLIYIFHVSKSTGGGTHSLFCGSRGGWKFRGEFHFPGGGCPEPILRLITPGVINMRPSVTNSNPR